MRRSMLFEFEPDGGEGDGGEGGAGAGEGGEGGGQGAGTFTAEQQAQVDRIIQERLARQRAQFKDYDELKAAADRLAELETANKTELEKAQERATKAEAERDAVSERAKKLITDAALTAAATGKLADPSDALALVDRGSIEYGEDGSPANIGALVDSLVEAKPHLAAGARKVVDVQGGARGNGATVTDASELMKLGDKEFLAAVSTGGVPLS